MKVLIKNVYVDLGAVIKIEKEITNKSRLLLYSDRSLRSKGITLTTLTNQTIEIPFDELSEDLFQNPIFNEVLTPENNERYIELQRNSGYTMYDTKDTPVKIFSKEEVERVTKIYEEEFEKWADEIIELWKKSDNNIKVLDVIV